MSLNAFEIRKPSTNVVSIFDNEKIGSFVKNKRIAITRVARKVLQSVYDFLNN